jgi:hypothetical protein
MRCLACFAVALAVHEGVRAESALCEDVSDQAVDAVLLPGSHWLRSSPDWVMGVSAMSSHAKDGSKHKALTVLDGNELTWWDIAAYSNQWVTFDLGIDATLSMVSFRKRNKGGIQTGKWLMSPTPDGLFVPIKTVNFAVGCKDIIVGFNDTTARYWKFQVLGFHRGVSQLLPDLAEIGFFGRFEKNQPGSNIIGLEEPATESKCPCVHDKRVMRQEEIASKHARTADICCALCIRTVKCKSWIFQAHEGSKHKGSCSLQSKLTLKEKKGHSGGGGRTGVVSGYLCHGESKERKHRGVLIAGAQAGAAGAGMGGPGLEGSGINGNSYEGGNGVRNVSFPLGHPQLGGSLGKNCFRTVHMVMELQGLMVSHLKLVLLLVSQWVGVTLQQTELQGITGHCAAGPRGRKNGSGGGGGGGGGGSRGGGGGRRTLSRPCTRFEIDVSSACGEAPTVQQKMKEMKQTPARFEEYVQLEAIARKICKVCCGTTHPQAHVAWHPVPSAALRRSPPHHTHSSR